MFDCTVNPDNFDTETSEQADEVVASVHSTLRKFNAGIDMVMGSLHLMKKAITVLANSEEYIRAQRQNFGVVKAALGIMDED